MSDIQNLSALNIKYLRQAETNKNVSVVSVPQKEDDKKSNKKLLLALAGLAVAGGVIALNIYKHKHPNAKAAQTTAQGAAQTVTQKTSQSTNVEKAKPPAASQVQNATEQLVGEELVKQNRVRIYNHYFPDKKYDPERPMWQYHDIQNKLYEQIRCCKVPYPRTPATSMDIGLITRKGNEKVDVLIQGGWHYREPKNPLNARTIGRISLNVAPEPELIEKLDNFVAKAGGAVDYKTPCSAGGWFNRHDPITMYFKRQITRAEADEIIKLVSPHVRKAEDSVMLGRKLADGIFMLPEPNETHVQKLIDRAKALNFDDKFVEFLNDTSWIGASLYQERANGQKFVRTSPGLVEAINRMLDDIEKIVAQKTA